MRLHTLEITAFGAFAGTETVDFDELGSDGLFLLHGQTGAGKTTVLDAVAYALYGTVPGSRQSGKRLHSDHADRDVCPRVVLAATIGGRDLRITRSPEFMRPKRRGEGFTAQPASGTLEWLDGSGENLSRLNDIGAEVLRLLGMSAEQFFQVVLLPQGEFARFLKAETKERANLLEKLFDTSRFNSVEDWFKERRRRSEVAVASSRQAIELELAGLATAAGAEIFAPTEEHPSALGWAQSLAIACESQVGVAEAALTTARADSTVRAAELARVQGLERAQRRAAAASAQLTAYLDGAAHREALALELDLAARAEKVDWAHKALVASTRDRDALAEAAADRERALSADCTVGPVLVAARADGQGLDRAALARSAREWDAELVLLEQHRDAEAGLARDVTALHGTLAMQAELATAAAANALRRGVIPDEIVAAARTLVEAQAAQGALAGLTQSRDEAAKVSVAADNLDRARARLATCEKDFGAAQTTHNNARDAALDLRERRLNGMAAELAGQLSDGAPCAVCGSTAHPEPAVAAENVVTKAAEDAAQKKVAAASAALEVARTALNDAQRAVVQHTAESGGLDTAAAGLALAEALEALRGAAELAATLPAAEASLAGLEDERARIDGDRAELETATALAEQSRAQLADRIEQQRATLESVVGEDAGVAARVDRISAARDQAYGLAELLGQVETGHTTAARDQATVDAAIVAAGFETVADALAPVRTPARSAEISEVISAAAEQSASARAVLQEPEVLAVAGLDPVSVVAAEEAAKASGEALEVALRDQDQAARRSAAVAAKFGELRAAVKKLAPIEERHESLAALAEVMLGDGQNSRRMSLGTYVLAARLEEVAVVASRRLRSMSGGRFEFIHSDGRVKRELRGGLALNILDANTGTVRPTSTLSGGETFMASLSLALGLADVVAEEAGGIQLETLFIDEGFGTLDAEALDMVMGVLDELRAGGRSVGIVSHVAEMQHRIPSRLFVKKGESGSTLHMQEA